MTQKQKNSNKKSNRKNEKKKKRKDLQGELKAPALHGEAVISTPSVVTYTKERKVRQARLWSLPSCSGVFNV